jgi:2-polyprenyl-3-methyl-5-hydroxy-6-metoxy-1,4-benzoquinol methylase
MEFPKRLFGLVGHKPVSVLDIGCAGGGMVKSFIDRGHIAVGIEGSDYSKNIKRAEWATIPEYLFTADATKPFTVHEGGGQPYKFDCVTAWEFFEHIAIDCLEAVLDNIKRHLNRGGLLIGSISNAKTTHEIVYHQTIRPAQWWTDVFSTAGFVLNKQEHLEEYFKGAWVRNGPIKLTLRKGVR